MLRRSDPYSTPYVIMYPSRRRVLLNDPKPGDIDARDIAHHLALINRFNGATPVPYTVAQHSVIVAELLEEHGPRLALFGLLHDAHEAYTADLITPVKKHCFGQYGKLDTLQHEIDLAIFAWAGIGAGMSSEELAQVFRADMVALATEWRDLMPDGEPCPTDAAPASFQIRPLTWSFAGDKFLKVFDRLTRLAGVNPGASK